MHEDILARVDLFAGLEKKDLQLLAGACRERKYSGYRCWTVCNY